MTADSDKIIWILVADWSSVESSEPNAYDVTLNIRPLYFTEKLKSISKENMICFFDLLLHNLVSTILPTSLNSIYFWKWTNANPKKNFRQLASHPKLLIGSKVSLSRLAGNRIPFRGTYLVLLLCRCLQTILEIPIHSTKSKSVPPEWIRFPASLGLVLTQLTTWDDWQAV